MSSSAANVARKLVDLTKATFVNGHWRKAEVSARTVNRLRKAAAAEGAPFELPLAPVRMVQPVEQGHKHQREKAKRCVGGSCAALGACCANRRCVGHCGGGR